MSLYKKFAGQTAIYGGGYVLMRLLNYLLVSLYLVNKLDSKFHIGLYNELYSYIALFLILLCMRMDTTFFRFSKNTYDRRKAMSSALIILFTLGLSFTGMVCLFAPHIAHFIGHPTYTTLIRFSALIIFFDVLLAIPFASLRVEERPLRFSLFKILQIGLFILWILVSLELAPRVFPGMNPSMDNDHILWWVFLGNVVTSFITLLLLLPHIYPILRRPDFSFVGRMLGYGWPLLLVATCVYLISTGYVWTLKYLLPGDVIENTGRQGLFAVVFKLAVIMQIYTTAYNYAAEPFFFQQSSHRDSDRVYGKVALGYVLVALVLILGVLLGVDLLFDLGLYSPIFKTHISLLPWLMLSLLLQGIYYNVSAWYKIKDKTLTGAALAAIGLGCYTLASILMIPKIGEAAVVFATLLAYTAMIAVNHMLKRGHFDVRYDYLKMLFYFLVMYALYYLNVLFVETQEPSLMLKYGFKCILFCTYIIFLIVVEPSFFRLVWGPSSKS